MDIPIDQGSPICRNPKCQLCHSQTVSFEHGINAPTQEVLGHSQSSSQESGSCRDNELGTGPLNESGPRLVGLSKLLASNARQLINQFILPC
jgi:hypothetical protein